MFPSTLLTARRLVILRRTYVSRAHPVPEPLVPITHALQDVLVGVEERKIKRAAKWERNTEQRVRQGKIKDDGPYRNLDETVELALNLNLDPRKPGQALRGSMSLPFGTGKVIHCAVFTSDAIIAKAALEQGAKVAGGDELVDLIVSGQVPVDFDRALASQDMVSYLTKKLARTLGPRGLMPNAKVGTLLTKPDELLAALKDQQEGQLQFRTDKQGTVHMGVGKGSFGYDKLLLNIRAALEEIQNVKPELMGKGKKATKNADYYLSAYMTATQGSSFKLDLRTVDPTASFFCTEILE